MKSIPTPTHYWKLAGNANDSIDIINGTWSGTETYTIGINGQSNTAASFDGSSRINISNPYEISTNDVTISGWIKKGSSVAGDAILSNDKVFNTSNRFIITMQSGDVINIQGGTSPNDYNLSSTKTITDNNWHFILFSRTGTSAFLMVDDSIVDAPSLASAAVLSNSEDWEIGMYQSASSVGWAGSISEIKLFEGYALSKEQAYQLYINEKDSRNAIAVNYKLNDGTGSTAKDSSYNANDGTIVDGSWTNGKFGKCLSFNGTSSYLSNTSFGAYSYSTFSCWAYFDSVSGRRTLIAGGATAALWHRLELNSTMYVNFDSSAGYKNFSTGFTPSANTWYNFTSVVTPTETLFYVNGVLKYSTTYATANPVITNDDVTIGGFAATSYMDGYISDVKIFSRALTHEEVIQEGYGLSQTVGGGPVNDTNLLAWYPLSGNPYDYSGNGRNGTVAVSWQNANSPLKNVSNIAYDGSSNSDRITLPNYTNWTSITTEFTICGWIKINNWTDSTAANVIWLVQSGSSVFDRNSGLALYIHSTNGISSFVGQNYYNAGADYRSFSSGIIPETEKWHWIAVSRDTTNLKWDLYWNGKKIASTTNMHTGNVLWNSNAYSGGQAAISQFYNVSAWTNYADTNNADIQVYNRYMEEEELMQIYRKGQQRLSRK